MSGATSSIRIAPRTPRSRQSGTGGALLEDLLELVHPLLDPFNARRPEDLLAAPTERVGASTATARLGSQQTSCRVDHAHNQRPNRPDEPC